MKDLLSLTVLSLSSLCTETMHVFYFRWSPEIPIRKNHTIKEVIFEFKNNSYIRWVEYVRKALGGSRRV